MIDYQAVINRIISEANSFLGKGKIADYIPALAEVSSDRLGIAVNLVDGRTFKTGDADIPFSIQSISKVFTLSMVVGAIGEDLWNSEGREIGRAHV